MKQTSWLKYLTSAGDKFAGNVINNLKVTRLFMDDIHPINMHRQFMQKAFMQAEQAYEEKEIPVGAVVVKNNRIIGKGYNQTERLKDATAHAEMLALSAASASLQNKYLEDCTLYVTLEPCPMCAGALVWSKIDRLVFGASDPKSGACGSVFNLAANKKLNHQVEIIQGVMEPECEWLLKQFFEERRLSEDGDR